MSDSNHPSKLSKEQIDSVMALYSSGQYQEAIEAIKHLNRSHPNVPLLFNLIGACYKALGQLQGAIKMFEIAVNIKSDYAEAHKNLGLSLSELGQLNDAIKCFERAIEVDKNYVDAHYNLAITHKDLGQFDSAVKSYENALKINPNFAQAHNNLGNVFKSMGKNEAAVECYQKAININPNFAQAHSNLGNALRSLNHREKSLNHFLRAYELKPDIDFLFGDILNATMHLCFWESLQELEVELIQKIKNNERVIAPFPLLPLIDDPELLRKNAEIFASNVHPKSDALAPIEDHPRHQKIRIGYFSGDFREHPVAYLTAELYEVHDRSHFEIHAFSFGPDTKDEMNLRIKAGVDHFHDVHAMSHQEIAELARSLEIDIAVDLAGYTAKSASDVFAIGAAPIQMSYIGYLGTMGADYYDYLIADPVMIPKESQKYYAEKIVYLPSFQVNDSTDLPPEITLTRKDVGLPEEGFVFCCFNNTYKFTPTIFDSWARILQQVENSVLIVYTKNELSKTNLTKEIEKRGIESKRLIFADTIDRPSYLARYRTADLFLDTHPYNAGTTASDALKMGLPMITYLGNCYQARMGASIVSALNLPELITHSLEEYEALAIELATNPEKMQAIKDKLASNLTTAPLYDTKLFTKNLESAYTQMYERYHEGLEPDHIYVE